jgi:hypothetical protein
MLGGGESACWHETAYTTTALPSVFAPGVD